MNRLLLTGGSGFVGMNLIPLLLSKKYELFITSIEENISFKNVNYIECNLLDSKKVETIIRQICPTHLIHLAWSTEPSNYNLPVNYDWLTASINLLESFRKNGGRKAVITGSCAEYDWNFGFFSESLTPLSYKTVYGTCKNLLQLYSSSYMAHYEMDLVWARLFFMYGPHEKPQRLVPYVIISLLKNQEAIIQNSELFRDFLFIEDVVKALVELIDSDYKGVINIGSGIPVKIEDLVSKIGDLLEKKELIKFNSNKAVDNKIVVADTKLISSTLNWRPEFNLEQGLTRTINWWKKTI